MKRKRWILKGFVWITAVSVIVCGIPMNAFAAQTTDLTGGISISTAASTDSGEPTVLAEETARRSQNTKHFRMSDGSYQAVVYSSAVHYLDADGV